MKNLFLVEFHEKWENWSEHVFSAVSVNLKFNKFSSDGANMDSQARPASLSCRNKELKEEKKVKSDSHYFIVLDKKIN